MLDTANWTVIFGNFFQTVALANAALVGPNIVQLDLIPGGAAPGPDRVSFAPPPFDVVGTAGGPAPAFADYPLHV